MNNLKEYLKKDIKANLLKYSVVKKLKEFNGVIAGGAITSIFTSSKINDVDVYFKSKKDLEEANEYFKSKNYEILSSTDNAITYKVDSNFIRKPVIVQLIIADELIKENPMDLINNFDFTINMASYDLAKEELIVKDDFFYDNIKRRLIFNEDTLYPIISMHRAIKYINRGYKLDGYEQVKIALAINNLHMKDYKDLKRQLQGIDTSIFAPITNKLMEKPETEYNYNDTMSLITNPKEGDNNASKCF